MRPVSTILLFQLAGLGTGYLFAEGCVSIRYGRRSPPLSFAPALATDYCWVLFILSILWLAYALYAERTFQGRFARDIIPLGLGTAGAMFFFFFPILAGVAVLLRPTSLHG
jgi:hypothetical protein